LLIADRRANEQRSRPFPLLLHMCAGNVPYNVTYFMDSTPMYPCLAVPSVLLSYHQYYFALVVPALADRVTTTQCSVFGVVCLVLRLLIVNILMAERFI
jgi:hypothetical protein